MNGCLRYFAVVLGLLWGCGLEAARPKLFIDNVNGAAPGAASGAPEAIGPIAAAATCHTNGVSTTAITWTANGLSGAGVPTDGSAILFLGTAAGRQYTQIRGLAADTVTADNNFNIAAAAPVDCAVGGRLLNLSTQLSLDMEGSTGSASAIGEAWEAHFQVTGVNYVWTAIRGTTAGTAGALVGDKVSGERPIIECNFTGAACFVKREFEVVGLEFHNTNANKAGTVGFDLNASNGGIILDTILGGPSAATAFETGINAQTALMLVGSLVRNNVAGISMPATAAAEDGRRFIAATVFRGNTTGLIGLRGLKLIGVVFWENGTGFQWSGRAANDIFASVTHTTFHGNTIGMLIDSANGITGLLFASNLLTSNGTGVSYTGAAIDIERESALVDFNCYGLAPVANGSDISGFVLGPNVIMINPSYRNAGQGDFTPTAQPPTFVAWPPGLDGLTPRTFPGTLTETELRCGAIQPGGVGGFSNVGI